MMKHEYVEMMWVENENMELTECDFLWLTLIDRWWWCRRPIWLACVASMAVTWLSLHSAILVIYRRQRWLASVHCACVCASVPIAVGRCRSASRIFHSKWLCALWPAAPVADVSLGNYAISTCCCTNVFERRRSSFPLACAAKSVASCDRNCSLWWMAFVSMNRQSCFADLLSLSLHRVRTVGACVASLRPAEAAATVRLGSAWRRHSPVDAAETAVAANRD